MKNIQATDIQKERIMKKFFAILLHVLIIGLSSALLIYNLFFNEDTDYSRIAKCVMVLVGYIFGVSRGERRRRRKARRNYPIYERDYENIISGAFTEDKKSYKKLLEAIDCFNNNQSKRAQKILDGLLSKCVRTRDYTAVYTFKALCFEDKKMYEQAIEAYQKVVQYDIADARAWSNMGLIYNDMGRTQEAYNAYYSAVTYNPEYPYAYNNMAHFLLKANDPEGSIYYGLKALELNSKMYQAMSALALAYKMLDDEENAEKYYKMYVLNGGNGENLRALLNSI